MLPQSAQCPSVHGTRSFTRTNLVRCRNPTLAKVRLAFISTSIGSPSLHPLAEHYSRCKMRATGEAVSSKSKSWRSLHQPVACPFQCLVEYFDEEIHVIALLQIDFVPCHFTSPFLVNFFQDPWLSFSRASSPGPSSYRPTKEAGGHGAAGLPASQLPFIRYASDRR